MIDCNARTCRSMRACSAGSANILGVRRSTLMSHRENPYVPNVRHGSATGERTLSDRTGSRGRSTRRGRERSSRRGGRAPWQAARRPHTRRRLARHGPRAWRPASSPASPKLMRVRKTMPSGTLHQRLMAPPWPAGLGVATDHLGRQLRGEGDLLGEDGRPVPVHMGVELLRGERARRA